MRKLIYKLTAHLLMKQFSKTTQNHYSDWCDHCRAKEAELILRKLSTPQE